MNPARDPETLIEIYRAALAAVEGGRVVSRALRRRGDRLYVGERSLPDGLVVDLLAAGKAATPMARAAEATLGDRLRRGLVVTKAGHGGSLRRCRLLEAGHPIPDESSERAGRSWLEEAGRGPEERVLLVLLSGGASALLTCPLPGLRLAELARTTDILLRAGASIDELNAVRKHLTAVAGGRAAARSRARQIELLALSDVPGDRFETIGSGPFSADPTSYHDAWQVVASRGVLADLPDAVATHLRRGVAGQVPETPKPGDPGFDHVTETLVGTLREALEAAACEATARGFRAVQLRQRLAGEARVVGRRLAALARSVHSEKQVCLIAGGETTVTVHGDGTGGRCQELALAAAIEGENQTTFALLAAGTDGSDGPTPAAGAWVDGATVERGRRVGADARGALARNDSHAYFRREGHLLDTGPTGTNVTDLVLIAVEARPRPETFARRRIPY